MTVTSPTFGSDWCKDEMRIRSSSVLGRGVVVNGTGVVTVTIKMVQCRLPAMVSEITEIWILSPLCY